MIIHVVAPGDTLFTIALQYGVSLEHLATDNAIYDPNGLVVGQTIVVRIPAETYVVHSGDTLSSIARASGLPLNALYRNNPALHGEDSLTLGQVLVLRYEGQPVGSMAVLGYACPNVSPTLMRSTLPHLTYLAPFAYGVTAQGQLLPLDDVRLLELTEQYGVSPVLHISTLGADGRFHSDSASMILNDNALQTTLIAEIGRTLYQHNYRGIDVDFEHVYAEDAANYAEFIRRLTTTFNPYGILVSVALAPKTSDEPAGPLYEGHDYRALGAAANSVLLTTCEWGYPHSAPMAVAEIGNVEQVVDYALTRIPAEKILMSVPNYGYDWPLPYVQGVTAAARIGNAEAVTIARQHGAEILFNSVSMTPYFTYAASDGIEHEVHFEDARSVEAKLLLAMDKGLFGVGYWNFMRPFPQNLLVLSSLVDILPG